MNKLKPYAKSVVGALVAGLSALYPLMDDGVTAKEWVVVAGATLAGLGLVFAVPNKPAE